MNGSRFTAWISDIERRGLEIEAKRREVTLNFLVRKAIRKYLGPEVLREAAEDVMDVTRNR